MRRSSLLALAVLPLLGFDCGGADPAPAPNPYATTLAVRGGVNEDLGCVVMAADWSLIDPTFTEFDVMLECVRGTLEIGAYATIFLLERPALNTPYGWDSTGVSPVWNVDSGDAGRVVVGLDGFPYETHSAWAPWGDDGLGRLYFTLTSIGAPDPANPGFVPLHGSLTGLIPSNDLAGDVTFSASF